MIMKFIIVPKEVHDTISIEVLKEHGIDHPLTIEDGSKVIMHLEHYEMFFPQTLAETEEADYPFPVYDQNDPAFQALIRVEEEEITE